MRPSLAEALDILAKSPDHPRRDQAIRCVCDALHAQARGDADREEAAQVVALRLLAGRIGPVGRSEGQAHAYLKQALHHAWLDEVRRAARRRAVSPHDVEAVFAPSEVPERDLASLRDALARLDRGEVPRALMRRRADHREALLHGIALRTRQLRALLEGEGRLRLTAADERASRRAAEALREAYLPDDAHPADAWIGRLAWLDLRTERLASPRA